MYRVARNPAAGALGPAGAVFVLQHQRHPRGATYCFSGNREPLPPELLTGITLRFQADESDDAAQVAEVLVSLAVEHVLQLVIAEQAKDLA